MSGVYGFDADSVKRIRAAVMRVEDMVKNLGAQVRAVRAARNTLPFERVVLVADLEAGKTAKGKVTVYDLDDEEWVETGEEWDVVESLGLPSGEKIASGTALICAHMPPGILVPIAAGCGDD